MILECQYDASFVMLYTAVQIHAISRHQGQRHHRRLRLKEAADVADSPSRLFVQEECQWHYIKRRLVGQLLFP